MSRLDRRTCASKTVLGSALIVSAVLLAGCSEKLRDLTDPTPDLRPTFSSIQLEIFSSSDGAGRPCCINCHTNVAHGPMGGLNLLPVFSYASIVAVGTRGKARPIRVVRGDPETRFLVHEGRSNFVRRQMPRNSSMSLTEEQMSSSRAEISSARRTN